MVIAAEYTQGSRRISPMVFISKIENGNREILVDSIAVSGKREARKVAAQFNAQPWNF